MYLCVNDFSYNLHSYEMVNISLNKYNFKIIKNTQ